MGKRYYIFTYRYIKDGNEATTGIWAETELEAVTAFIKDHGTVFHFVVYSPSDEYDYD